MVKQVVTKKRFRLRSTKFFLTYPQLPKEIDLAEMALLHYESIFHFDRNDFKYLIATELHEDGNPHLHVYLEFTSVQSVHSETKFDLMLDNENHHGNYQAVRSKHNVIQYIIKSIKNKDDLVRNMMLPIYKNQYYTNVEDHIHAVLVNEGYSSCVEMITAQYPREMLLRGTSLIRNLDLLNTLTLSQEKAIPSYTLDQFEEVREEILMWVKQTGSDSTSLFLYGPSGTGKTEFAKAFLDSYDISWIFIRNREGLRLFSPDRHKAIIFDDLNLNEFAREEMINLFDSENISQIRILYNYVQFPAFTKKIFTGNYFHYSETELCRRVTVVLINKPLFKKKPIKEIEYRAEPMKEIEHGTERHNDENERG